MTPAHRYHPSKSKKKNKTSKFRQETNNYYDEKPRKPQDNRRLDSESAQGKTDAASVVIPHMQRDLDVQQVDSSVNIATNLGISPVYVTRKKSKNTREIQENPEHIN